MNEFSNTSQPEERKSFRVIGSPVEMARAVGFDPVAKHQGRDRWYTKEFVDEKTAYSPAIVITLHSEDFHNGELEEVYAGVQLKEAPVKWGLEYNVLSKAFLGWMVANGSDVDLVESIDKIEKMEDLVEKGRLTKRILREEGYDLVAKIIRQAEELGYFEHLRKSLVIEIEKKKVAAEAEIKVAEEGIRVFLDAFPQYSIFSNHLEDERTVYAAIPSIRKGRVRAMKITVRLSLGREDEGTIEFQLGTMAMDGQNNLTRFFQIDPPKDADSKYPRRWFSGRLYGEEGIIGQAITARKNIPEGLGKL